MDEHEAQKLWGELFEHERHMVEYKKEILALESKLSDYHRISEKITKTINQMNQHEQKIHDLRIRLANG